MKIHEYQGKEIFRKHNIATPNGIPAFSVEEALEAYKSLKSDVVAVKAQIHAGGRGKAGGIKVAKDINELTQYSEEILGMDIKGHKVEILLLEEASNILEEYYISFTLDRSEKKYLIMLSAKGGMDIEQVAEENPDDLVKFHVSPSEKLMSSTISELINKANLNKDHEDSLSEIIENLYLMFTEGDCDLVEVNPLAITDNGVMALDSKVSLDMNAKYKHPYFDDFEQEIPIPESEKNAKEKGLNFIKLDGSVGIIGNGAGLVMSTLDVVAENGGKAANFLDIGGGAKAETVSSALEVLEADQNVKSVLINIFGGITRCDLVAEGIIEATKGKELVWPIIIRLDGTNSLEGLEILKANPNEKIFIEESMDSAAKLAVQKGL